MPLICAVPHGLECTNYVKKKGHRLPLFSSHISAGFPSPADDHLAAKLDLNEHLIQNPAASFFLKASGDSMINAGIHDGDILLVDKRIEPTNGKVVIAAIDGALTVKRLIEEKNQKILRAENENYKDIQITEEQELVIWGVVTNVIHKV